MVNSVQEKLYQLYTDHTGKTPEDIRVLPLSGSSRRYFRLSGSDQTLIGVYNADHAENDAFVYMARHFRAAGLAVPEVYSYDKASGIYLQEDLGDLTLFGYLEQNKNADDTEVSISSLYRKVLDQLVLFQTKGSRDFDFTHCYPRPAFDRQSMVWDLNYFKYFYLKLAGIPFDEQKLEEDFHQFCTLLERAKSDYFLYRDFQSRNIMLKGDQVWFIDFQGGRKGSLAYDVASLLYDAKANLSESLREELLQYYIDVLALADPDESLKFKEYYYHFVFIRIMQAMGAYGYRGLFEKKRHFLLSIPYAVKNLKWLLTHHPPGPNLPELSGVLKHISETITDVPYKDSSLNIIIYSFSFKKGYPEDKGNNGGGFVFDCRALPNPGREPEYKTLTGKDAPVVSYLNARPEVHAFINNVFQLIDSSVENYMQRGFSSLVVSFGCTGGQHRSVFMAENLAKHLNNEYHINTELIHREFPGI